MYTSPVGVILFDAQSGTPVSLNREARRIVDRLREPDQTPEDLLQTISYRRGDGRQLSVAEFPLTRSLSTGESVRGEGDRPARARRPSGQHDHQRDADPR